MQGSTPGIEPEATTEVKGRALPKPLSQPAPVSHVKEPSALYRKEKRVHPGVPGFFGSILCHNTFLINHYGVM